jgi:glycosyltransferase involved in cell wall biosynthesis
MKIFHGPQNIGGMAGVLAAAQRELGHDAWAYCYPVPSFKYGADRVVTATTRPGRVLEWMQFFLWEEHGFDCFHFYFGESLSGPYLWDVPWLKRLGKRVFFYFCGCDIRDSKHVVATYEYSACKHCWPMLCSANRVKARHMALEYADGVFVSTPDLLEFVPGATFLPQPIDIAGFDELCASQGSSRSPGQPGVDRPVRLVHAPSNRQIKGTPLIIEAVERLQRRGLNIDLVMVEHKSHAEALALCAAGDLAIDQVRVGAYGQYAVEMMALGKPTVCYIRDDLRQFYPPDCPIISASPATLEAVLGEWVTHPAWWPAAGAAGRTYVKHLHDKRVVARRCLEAYSQAGGA